MRQMISALTLVVLGAGAVQAQTGAVEGPGARSCADFTAAQANDPQLFNAFGGWISGYMTASNVHEADTFDLTPWQPLDLSILQIVNYCQANADKRVIDATAAYLGFLRADRLTEPSELVQARNGEQAVFVYEEMLVRIRAALRDRGFTLENDTGFDAELGEALRQYQTRNALDLTGLPDARTLMALFKTE